MKREKERARLMNAAKKIFEHDFTYSCSAISTKFDEFLMLRYKYADFYGLPKSESSLAAEARFLDVTFDQARLARQLALLLFRETL